VNIELMTAIITITVLAGVVALRSATAGKVQITLNDAIIAAIAAALALLVSGKLSKVVVGSEGVTIETAREAILSSAAKPIAQQVNALPVVPLEQALKGGVGEIPNMVRRRVQGLDFMLGFGGYDQTVLKAYLETLTRYDFFRYIILLTQDNRLFGMVDARSLLAALEDPGSGETFQDFATLLNHGSDADRHKLAQLPGFVPAEDAVTKQSDKRDVLTRMEKSGRDWLPVVSANGQLDGIVERSRLTASMILDVANQLQAAQAH
jgi:CBS domain-containing protein